MKSIFLRFSLISVALLFVTTLPTFGQITYTARINEIFDPFGTFDSSVHLGTVVTATFTFDSAIPLETSGDGFAEYAGVGGIYSSAITFGNYAFEAPEVFQSVTLAGFTDHGLADSFDLRSGFAHPFLIFTRVVFPLGSFGDTLPKLLPFDETALGGEVSFFYEADGNVALFDATIERFVPVPEPSTYGLLAAAGLFLVIAAHRRSRSNSPAK